MWSFSAKFRPPKKTPEIISVHDGWEPFNQAVRISSIANVSQRTDNDDPATSGRDGRTTNIFWTSVSMQQNHAKLVYGSRVGGFVCHEARQRVSITVVWINCLGSSWIGVEFGHPKCRAIGLADLSGRMMRGPTKRTSKIMGTSKPQFSGAGVPKDPVILNYHGHSNSLRW